MIKGTLIPPLQDGKKDLLLAGNNFQSEVETTRADAGTEAFQKGDGSGNFQYIRAKEAGFFVDGNVRNMELVKVNDQNHLVVANNNGPYQMLRVNK